MNGLFIARNMLRESSFQNFAQFLQKNRYNLQHIDFNNLLQQSFNLYKKSFIDYLRLFHKFDKDIIFSKIDDGKNSLTVLQEILIYRKQWQLEQLIKIDQRIVQDLNLNSIKYVIQNSSKILKDQKNGYQMIHKIIKKRPDIIQTIDEKNSPLVQALRYQLYQIAILLLKYNCGVIKSKNYCSNQFHFLFSFRFNKNNKNSNKNDKILQISRILFEKKVDIYQKNENGKPAFDFCPKDLKQQIQKQYKLIYCNSRKYNHSNNHRNHNQKYHKNNKNNSSQNQGRRNDNFNKYDNILQNNNYEHFQTNSGNNNSSNLNFNNQNSFNQNLNNNEHSYNKGKIKIKSQFENKQTNKYNNQLIRLNINSKQINNKSSGSKDQTTLVKVLNYDELENEASLIFQRHMKKQIRNHQIQKQKIKQQIKNKTKIIQNQQLKYYLKQDIKRFANNIKKQNQITNQSFDILLHSITQQLQKILPITVKLYGSYATQLHLQRSDIDLVIIPQPQCTLQPLQIFQKIIQKLSQLKLLISQTIFLDKASVPIIKATSTLQYKYKSIDISYQHEYHNGIKSVILIKQYLLIYPQLKNLILVLKNFIYQSNLYTPYSGGLSSYGLILMIFAFINSQECQNIRIINNNNNNHHHNKNKDVQLRTAELLIGFLKFYGFKMDYVTQKLIIIKPQNINKQNYQKCTIYNTEWNNQFPPIPKLNIMDPLSEDNNVGKHTRRIKQIKIAFQLAYIAIHTNKRCKGKNTCESYKNIKYAKVPEIRFQQNKRPCCILDRMFNSTQKFDLHMY